MDILLLSTPAAARDDRPRLFSHAGVDRLATLLAWLGEDRVPFDLWVHLPAEEGERRAAFAALSTRLAGLPGATYLLVPVAEVTDALLDALVAHGLTRLVLVGGGGPLPAEAAALRVLRARLDRDPETPLVLGAWLPPRAGPDSFARTRLYADAGISPAVIDVPAFAAAEAGEAEAAEAEDAPPPELMDGILPCRLHRGALTLDADGAARLCPRDGGETFRGSLFEDAPEELVMRRGGEAAAVGALPPCRGCALRGGWSWPERRSLRLEQLWAAGAHRMPGGPDLLARLAPVAHRDLARADEAAVASDLGAFEARLQAWSETVRALEEEAEEGAGAGTGD